MTGFFALLRLQLLSRYADLKPRNLKNALKEKRGRTIGTFIAVLFLVIYLGVMLYIVETKMLEVLIQIGTPEVLITMAVMLSTAGTLVMSFFFVLSSLYLGRDAGYLATLPLKSRTILSAKLMQVWLSETGIDALLILPACILYGVKTGAEAAFYLRMILVWLLVAMLPICLIAFLSSLLIRLSALWKHREMLVTVSGIVLLVAYMFLMANLGGLTGDAADGGEMLQRFMESNAVRIQQMTRMFPPAAWAAEGMLGQNSGLFLLWILISLAAPAVTVWLLGYGYRKLSTLQSETPAGGVRKRAGRKSFTSGTQLKTCAARELKTILRVPSYATNILPICFMPLLMVILIIVLGGKAGGDGEGLRTLIASLPGPLVLCILTAVMAYMSGMNMALTTAVTREGRGHDFLTALPVPYMTLIRAKFIVGYGLGSAGIAMASVVLMAVFPGFIPEVIMALILCLLFSYANGAIALSRDIRRPKLDWVTEQEAVKQNYGALIAMLISWAILITLGVLCYFLITWGLDTLPLFAILAVLLAGFCAAARVRMKRNAERFYCAG